MRKIFTSYDVEVAYSLDDLRQQCEHAASMSWECIGGISVCFNPIENKMQYFQAMGLRGSKLKEGDIEIPTTRKASRISLPSFEEFMKRCI